MTQYYAVPKFRLGAAPPATKVLVSLFVVGVLGALALGVYTFYRTSGFTPGEVIEHYRGNEDDLAAAELKFPKSEREVLEFLHIHSFTLLLLMFIICHLLALTRAPEGMKIATYVLTFLSLAGMIAGPWCVRFVSPAFAPPLVAAGGAFLALCLVQSIVVLGEVWLGGSPNQEDR